MRSLRRLLREPWSRQSEEAKPCPWTILLAEFDRGAEPEQAHDIVLRAGGVHADIEGFSTGRVVSALFRGVSDATRALMEIVQAVADTTGSQASANPLAGLRIVLHTGTAMADSPEERRRGLAAAAKRLHAKTKFGQILVTAPAAVVAGPTLPSDVHLLDRGLWTLTRETPPERVYQMIIGGYAGAGRAASNLEWARRAVHGAGDLVAGRPDDRLDAVRSAWGQAVEGTAQITLVSGRPEIRDGFVAEAALRLHAEGALVLYGRWVQPVEVPYRAFREALGFYADAVPTQELVTDLEGWADAVAKLLPDVGTRVGGVHLAQTDSGVDRAQVFEAVEAWLGAIAMRAPTLVVLDDAHCAEPASVLLLAHLWHTCRRRRLMFLVTGADQPGNALDRLADLVAHPAGTTPDRIVLG